MKYLFIFSIFFFALGSEAQTIIFEEDFQSPNALSNWKLINDNNIPHADVANYTDAWITVTDPANNLDTVVSATSYFQTPAKANRWLISPAVQLGTYGNFISWNGRSFDPSFPDDYLVLISTSDNEIASFTDTVALHIYEDYQWTNFDVSLSALGYNNQTVYFAFVLNTLDGNRIFIDDITVRKEDALSINENNSESTFLKSTIVSESLIIQTKDFEEATVFSSKGSKLFSFNNSSEQISTQSIDNGSYFVYFKTKSGVKIERFFKF